MALVIGLPNGGPRSLLLVHLVRVRVRVRVSQPYQPKTLSPTLQAENPKPDLRPLLIVRVEAILVVRLVVAQLEPGEEILEGDGVAIDAGWG